VSNSKSISDPRESAVVAHHLRKLKQTTLIARLELDVRKQKVVDHRSPDLIHNGILRSAEKCFDFQILLDSFEKQLPGKGLAMGSWEKQPHPRG
jgi:hypothetical protein